MNKIERIEELKNEINDLYEQLSDYGKEFYDDYDITTINDLSDAFYEFADGRVDIYYNDIDEYYENHIQESSDALKEFGYTLKDFDDLQDACRKGAQLAQCNEICCELSQNEDIFNEIIEKFEEIEELEKEDEE